MKAMDFIRQLIRDYFVIFGVLIIGSVLLNPPNTINRDFILLAMAFAAIGDLPSIVFWSRSELSESSMRLRSVIHFILLMTLILIFAGITGVVSGFAQYLIFAAEVIIIYIIVKFIIYQGDMTTAKMINEKLKGFSEIDEQ